MPASSDEFSRALSECFSEAERMGLSFIGLEAKALHRRVGGYPGPDHRMPVCCRVMRAAMGAEDRIVHQPPKGDGASLLIHYALPR